MATNLQYITRAVSGTGNPQTGDRLVREITTFKINTLYVNKTDGSVWIRKATGAVEADWETLESGGGGGSDVVQKASITLTDAQIKTLPTAPRDIVAAPGAGKIIVPISAMVILNTTAGAYTGVTDASFQLSMQGTYVSAPVIAQASLLDTGINILPMLIPIAENGTGAFDGTVVTRNNAIQGDWENKPLQIFDFYAGIGNYGGGNSANTMKVLVSYIIVDI